MSNRTYVVKSGDTLSKIAARFYGSAVQSTRIKKANGGITVITPGQVLLIPDLPERQRPAPLAGYETDALTIVIEGKQVQPSAVRVRKALDCAVDAWTACIPWMHGEDPELDKLFRPFTYPRASVYMGNELIVDGMVYGIDTDLADESMVRATGYSFAADAVDSTISPPYEWYNVTLEQHATNMLKPLGIRPVFEFDSGEKFWHISIEPTTTIFNDLADLAFCRGLLITSTPEGNLLFTRENTGKSVGTLEEGGDQVISLSGEFDGRKMFNSYMAYGFAPLAVHSAVVADESISRARQMTFSVDYSTDWDVGYSAEYQRNKQLASAVSIDLELAGWLAPNGLPWTTNTRVTVISERLFVPGGFDFLIRSVEFVLSARKKTTRLSIVPPGVYAERGTMVKTPW